jgi:hypothetical protein
LQFNGFYAMITFMKIASGFSRFLETEEKVVGSTPITDEEGVDFDIITISHPDITEGDRVLLDIATKTGKNVLIGGNPLDVTVLKGLGELTMIDLKDGTRSVNVLKPGVRVTIPSDNIVYWYENKGPNNLLLRDSCPGFDIAHEPSVGDVVQAMSKTILA